MRAIIDIWIGALLVAVWFDGYRALAVGVAVGFAVVPLASSLQSLITRFIFSNPLLTVRILFTVVVVLNITSLLLACFNLIVALVLLPNL